jgi:hypothetical protein
MKMVLIEQIQSSQLWLVRTIRIVSGVHLRMITINARKKIDIKYEKVNVNDTYPNWDG